jgi:ribosomal protein L18
MTRNRRKAWGKTEARVQRRLSAINEAHALPTFLVCSLFHPADRRLLVPATMFSIIIQMIGIVSRSTE